MLVKLAFVLRPLPETRTARWINGPAPIPTSLSLGSAHDLEVSHRDRAVPTDSAAVSLDSLSPVAREPRQRPHERSRRVNARIRPLLGAARRFIAARLAARPQSEYVRPRLDGLDTPPGLPSRLFAPLWLAIGRFMETVEQPTRALTFYIRAGSGGSDAGVALASRVALDSGPTSVRREPNLGLVTGRAGDPELARDLATRLSPPASEREAAERAMTATRRGDYDTADELLTGFDGIHAMRARGEILFLRGRSRGGQLVAEANELRNIWQQLLERDPTDHQRRHRLVRHLVSMGDFEGARHIAWPAGPPPPADLGDSDFAKNAPTDWLYAVHAEQLTNADPVGAHHTKLLIARRVAASPRRRAEPLWQLVERARALSYLDEVGEARRELAVHGPRQQHARDRLAVDKLAADLALSEGEIEPLLDVRRNLASPSIAAEEAFRQAVDGASVLVIGPAPGTQPDPDTIAAADVVVTTKRQRTLRSDQTSVTYVSDASALLEPEHIIRDHGHFSVLRPSMVGAPGRSVPSSATVRVMQCEDLNTFLGTRFGIQRLLYDLVSYTPQQLILSGVDFYLGDTTYLDGYDNEVTEIYGPQDLQPVLSVAPHDHLWDFRFTQRLLRNGLITATDEVERILHLSEEQYLQRLSGRLGNA